MDDTLPIDNVTLIDDDGVEREFEVLDFIENSQGMFYALMPNFELDNGLDKDETYFIFEIVKDENGEEQLVEVDDDELLDSLSKEFEKRLGTSY